MASVADALAEVFLPASCARCSSPLPGGASRGGVCRTCWSEVGGHVGTVCPRCGEPGPPAEDGCLTCREEPRPWLACATYGPYRGALRDLVLMFKYQRLDELATPLSELLAPLPGALGWPPVSAIVPVPLPIWRRLRRGFNQAERLASRLGRRLGLPTCRALRRRGRGAQVGRNRAQRRRLPHGAFTVCRPVSGAVLLVDDVVTTGSTASACTRALLRGGADSVYVLALARAAGAWRPA